MKAGLVIALGLALLATCGDDRAVLERPSGSVPTVDTVNLPPLVIDQPATVVSVAVSAPVSVAPPIAVRVSAPPAPSTTVEIVVVAPGDADGSQTCEQYEPLLAMYPGWDVARMSRIMWRESRCEPWAHNTRTGDRGLLQTHWESSYWTRPMRSGFGTLAAECDLHSLEELFIPEVSVRCSYALYRAFGMNPWSTK